MTEISGEDEAAFSINTRQIRGALDRIGIGGVAFICGKLGIDASMAVDIATVAGLSISGLAISIIVNRRRSIQQSAVDTPNTLMIKTSPGTDTAAIAQSLAHNPCVTQVIATEQIAQSAPSNKVVPA